MIFSVTYCLDSHSVVSFIIDVFFLPSKIFNVL